MKQYNYLQMIYDAFYDPSTFAYQAFERDKMGIGYYDPISAILLDQEFIRELSRNEGFDWRKDWRENFYENAKRAIGKAAGIKLSFPRKNISQTIMGEWEYNGKRFFVRYENKPNDWGRKGFYRILWVASEDSIKKEDLFMKGIDFVEAETFEASIVNRGKQPKGAVAKTMMNHAMMERAEIESVIQELENKVQLGIISEEDLMKSLTQRFGADFEVIDWNNLHDTNRELFVQKTQEYYNDFKENNPKLHEDFEENVMNEESWYGYERGKSYAETKEKWTKKLSDLGYEYERIDDYWEYIGYENTSHYVPCNNCEGEGIIITKYYPATREDPADADYVDCEMCEGKGKVLEEMNAETKKGKLSKTSCCCGATESNPCACMKAPKPMNCSATEPKCQCYKDLEKNAEEGDDCPNCYCEHQNLSLDGTPSVDEEYVSVNVVCDDCGMRGYTTTYPYEWDNEAKLEDVGLPLAVSMYNPNYGELRCSRCRERFEKSAENYVLDVE